MSLVTSARSAPGQASDGAARAPSPRPFARGVVVSCPGYGEIWGSDAMRDAVRELKRLGVEWIQIHPYARIDRSGQISFRPAAQRAYMERAVQIVRSEGLQLFIKPHLSYWGSFTWRGAITFDTDAAWAQFFDGYRAFILDQARFARDHGVPALAVGTELEQAVRFEDRWRSLIAEVRQIYDGHLTYAANWDGLERVEFWDALDSIGVQAYFPMGDRSSSRAALERRWVGVLDELRGLSIRWDRPVVFAEIGYTRSVDAAARPWEPERQSSPEAIRVRTQLADIALEHASEAPFVLGMFWWKWIPGWSWSQRDFSMRDPEMKALLEKHWGESS